MLSMFVWLCLVSFVSEFNLSSVDLFFSFGFFVSVSLLTFLLLRLFSQLKYQKMDLKELRCLIL